MSNCINSGINKVYILTQYNSASLNRHLTRAYNFGSGTTFGDGFVEVSSNYFLAQANMELEWLRLNQI